MSAPTATFTLAIQAISGYEAQTEGVCTPEQYGNAMAALHGQPTEAEKSLLEFAQEVRRSGDLRLASMAIAVIAKATGGAA